MTNTPTPETDDFRPCHLTPSDWPAFARALEIERNEARAERDEHIARNNDSLLALHLTTAQRDEHSEALERNCIQYVQKQQSIIAERDEARADVARLRDVLEGMLIAEMEVRQAAGWGADEVEAEPHWMAARAALATPAQ
jgi:hypothetical protein